MTSNGLLQTVCRHHWRAPSTSCRDAPRSIPLAGPKPHRGPTSNRILPSKYADRESNLYYFGYRYYASGMGRWLRRDPTGEDAGPGLYRFCANSATTRTDPDGTRDLGEGEWPRAVNSNGGCCADDINNMLRALSGYARDSRFADLMSGRLVYRYYDGTRLLTRRCLARIDCGTREECSGVVSHPGSGPCRRCSGDVIAYYRHCRYDSSSRSLVGGEIIVCAEPTVEALVHELQHAAADCTEDADCLHDPTESNCRKRFCQEVQAFICGQTGTGKVCDPNLPGFSYYRQPCFRYVAELVRGPRTGPFPYIHSQCPDCYRYLRDTDLADIARDCGVAVEKCIFASRGGYY
jgi:RHS repeat-associated protein